MKPTKRSTNVYYQKRSTYVYYQKRSTYVYYQQNGKGACILSKKINICILN